MLDSINPSWEISYKNQPRKKLKGQRRLDRCVTLQLGAVFSRHFTYSTSIVNVLGILDWYFCFHFQKQRIWEDKNSPKGRHIWRSGLNLKQDQVTPMTESLWKDSPRSFERTWGFGGGRGWGLKRMGLLLPFHTIPLNLEMEKPSVPVLLHLI